VEEFLQNWGYLGIFVGILATGIGFPMPEELPIVVAGGLASRPDFGIDWWLMLPVCIVGVVIGDGLLYGIGRLWGPRLLEVNWVKRHLLPPDRRAKVERNFHEHGIKILLFARITPGIRGTIFFTAGLIRLPLTRFLIADGIYAVPGVSFLFTLGYYFTEHMVKLTQDVEKFKSVVVLVVILAVAGYFLYRFLRRPVVTGDPTDVPKLVEQVQHTFEHVTTKIIHPLSKSQAGQTPANDAPEHERHPDHREKATEEKKDQV
jgi:membrane protein DedA with SNARE-associated domain